MQTERKPLSAQKGKTTMGSLGNRAAVVTGGGIGLAAAGLLAAGRAAAWAARGQSP